MNVASPIASVVPSVDGPVYAALAGSAAPQTLTSVRRLAGRSLEGVRITLRRMVAAGLVLEVPGGYVLNREHLAAPGIEYLCDLHGQLAERIRGSLDRWGGQVDLVGLFGSAARRDGDADSDIDVLVVSDAPDLDEFTGALADAIRRWTGNDAQVIGRSASAVRRLVRTGEPIVSEWAQAMLVVRGSTRVLKSAA